MNAKILIRWSLTLVIFIQSTGCAPLQNTSRPSVHVDQMTTCLPAKPAALQPAYKRLYEEGHRNFVLNQMEIGLDAYQLGHKKLAATAFSKAVAGIEVIYSDDENTRKARSLWYEEGMKDFKGEAYERAMAYYYRGLLLLEEGDYENARAALKSGVLQDAFAEEEQNRCDFALLIFLEGWASKMAGDNELAKTAYKELDRLRPDFSFPPDANLLLLIETGLSPRKVADGPGHGELKFRRGRNFTEKKIEITLAGGKPLPCYPMEDIFLQAATRGGRMVDKIIKGKVHFREKHAESGSTLSEIGSAAMVAGSLFSAADSFGDSLMVGGSVLGLLGVTQMAIANKTKANADTRYWDNLPDSVFVCAEKVPPGQFEIDVVFKDKNGEVVEGRTKHLNIEVEQDKPKIVVVSSRKRLSK